MPSSRNESQLIGYITVVKTSNLRVKGVLSEVNDSLIYILHKGEQMTIAAKDIRKVKILRASKKMNIQNLKVIPWFETEISQNASYTQQTAENAAANLAVNAMFIGGQLATKSLIKTFNNSNWASIEKFSIEQDISKYSDIKHNLERYSIYYQTHATPNEQLNDIKEITEKYRAKFKEGI